MGRPPEVNNRYNFSAVSGMKNIIGILLEFQF